MSSPYEAPVEQIEFKVGDTVFQKDYPEQKWTVLGFSNGHVRLLIKGEPREVRDISESDLNQNYTISSRKTEEKDELIEQFEKLVE